MARMDVKKQEFVAAVATVASFLAERWFDEAGSVPVSPSNTLGAIPLDPGDPVFNRKEAARFLRVSVSTLGRFVKAGELKPIMLTGKAPKYRREDLERLLRRKQ